MDVSNVSARHSKPSKPQSHLFHSLYAQHHLLDEAPNEPARLTINGEYQQAGPASQDELLMAASDSLCQTQSAKRESGNHNKTLLE
jgi:hypothetical protein